MFSYHNTAPCLPSPCINNGTCVTVNVTDQYCVCVISFIGQFCDVTPKVSAEILYHNLIIWITVIHKHTLFSFCSFIHLD